MLLLQEAVLLAFESSGWALEIAVDNLIPVRMDKRRLRNTVENLNRSVRPRLHFRLEGSGSRVCWESL
jgi:hypothetical protein